MHYSINNVANKSDNAISEVDTGTIIFCFSKVHRKCPYNKIHWIIQTKISKEENPQIISLENIHKDIVRIKNLQKISLEKVHRH